MPSGTWTYYGGVGREARLTSALEKVFDDSQPAFSPDGRTLAFVRKVALVISDIYLLTLAEDFLPLRFPDGRWILYQQIEMGSDLMLVENFR